MIKEPLFNSAFYDSEWKDPKGGTTMSLFYIKDMPISNDTMRLRCQLYDCGFRVTRTNKKDEYWNQTTYEDVDYKNWIIYCEDELKDKSRIIDPLIIHKKIFAYIVKHWPEMFLYAEISRHENGFHYIFYFDIPRTNENWNKCKLISHAIVSQAFINCGYEDIINLKKGKGWNDVFDDCADSEFQLCYITKKHPMMNPYCTGEVKEYDNLNVVEYKTKKEKHVSNGDEYIVTVEKEQLPQGKLVEYIDHYGRWHLYDALRRLYPDTYEDEYDYCCEHMTEKDDHSMEWYKSRSEGSSWDRDWKEDCYIDAELMKMFGYHVTFIKKTQNKGRCDFINLLGI